MKSGSHPVQDPHEHARRERRRRARVKRARRRGLIRLALLLGGIAVVGVAAISSLGGGGSSRQVGADRPAGTRQPSNARGRFAVPPLLDPHDVYAADRPGMLSPVVRDFPSRVYVPNSESDTVSVINPRTYKVIDQFPVGRAAPARRPRRTT